MNNYSLFVKHPTTGATVELSTYDSPVGFQLPNHFLLVNNDRYVPLDVVGAEFDSGLRVTVDGVDYQVSSSIIYNIIATKLSARNMFLKIDTMDDLYRALVYLFGATRVKLGNGFVSVVAPTATCGLTKLLAIGANLKIDDGVVLWSTSANGWTSSAFGGERRGLSKAMLLKMKPHSVFRVSFSSAKYVKPTDLVNNCLFVGSIVETFPEKASSYADLRLSSSFCTFDQTKMVSVDVTSGDDDLDFIRENMLNYSGSDGNYNFYKMSESLVEGTGGAQ